MKPERSVTHTSPDALPTARAWLGTLLGALGVLTFSFSFPATKLALHGFSPWCSAFGRAAVASVGALAVLAFGRAPRPTALQLRRLAVVAAGVVVGFPALSSLALQTGSAAHGAVVVGLLPAATAVVGALRAGERPSRSFWAAAAAGTVLVTGYTLARSGGRPSAGDLELLLAVALCAVGYAEGGLLSRTLGGPQTICWALLLSAPVTVPVALLTLPARTPSASALAGFAYISLGSMFLGFFAWYAGLARGGVARVSQIQLMQTPLTLLWSALVLGEHIDAGTAAVALLVLVAVAATQRSRVRIRAAGPLATAQPG